MKSYVYDEKAERNNLRPGRASQQDVLYRTLTAHTPVARTGSIGSVVPERGILVKTAKLCGAPAPPGPAYIPEAGCLAVPDHAGRCDARPRAETAEPNRRTHQLFCGWSIGVGPRHAAGFPPAGLGGCWARVRLFRPW